MFIHKKNLLTLSKAYFKLALFICSYGLVAQSSSHQLEILLQPFDLQKTELELNKLVGNLKSSAQVDFVSDNNVHKDEFEILADFGFDSIVTQEKIIKFLKLVEKKKRFKSVVISFVKDENSNKLSFSFKGAWVLGDLKIHGISLGKDSYRRFYRNDPGDQFLLENHKTSLNDMVNSLKKKGRCLATITDHFSYNSKNKSIKVHAAINKGYRFKINSIEIALADKAGKSCDDDYVKMVYKKYFSSLVRKKYDETALALRTKFLREQLIQDGFSDVSIVLKEEIDEINCKVKIKLVCTVGEQHRSIFIGNYFFTSEELQKRISKFSDSIGLVPLTLLAQDLKNEYLKKGFFEVKIETREEENDNYFIIHEGPRALLTGLLIKESSYDQKFLEKNINFKCTKSNYYDEGELKKSVDTLLFWYQSQGFLDIKILKKSIEESTPENYIFTLILNEGICYTYEKVTVPGYEEVIKNQKLFEDQSLNKSNSTVVFTYKKMQEQRIWLVNYFKQDGYLFVRCVPEIQKVENKVFVVWRIDLGNKINFGKTIVRGVTRLPYKRLLKEVAYQEGQVWSAQLLQETQEHIQKLGMYKQVSVFPDPEDAQNSLNAERQTIIQLQENDPFEIAIRCGFQQVSKNFGFKKGSTYKIGGSFLWRNPFNNADQLRVDGDFTRFERKFSASYLLPRTLDVPVLTTFKIYNNKYSQPVSLGHKATLYDALQQGFLISLTHNNYSAVSAGFNIGIELMETKNLSELLANAIDFNPNLIGKKIPYLLMEPNLFIDCLDDKLNPRSGFYSVVSLKGMFPFKESSYFIKAMAEHAFFKEIFSGSGVVFGIRARLGHIFRETFNRIMPPERFYLGGPHSVRGYQPDGCPPLGSFIDDKGLTQWVSKGGKTMINVNLETRFPLLLAPLQGVVFQDFGVLASDATQITHIGNSFASTGFGLRYTTPIGPLRFDIGWKWKKAYPEDCRYGWCLTFGHAF